MGTKVCRAEGGRSGRWIDADQAAGDRLSLPACLESEGRGGSRASISREREAQSACPPGRPGTAAAWNATPPGMRPRDSSARKRHMLGSLYRPNTP